MKLRHKLIIVVLAIFAWSTAQAAQLIRGDLYVDEGDVTATGTIAAGSVDITQTTFDAMTWTGTTEGVEDTSWIFLDDNRTGATADESGEASVVIDVEGAYAFTVLDGYTRFQDHVQLSSTVAAESRLIMSNDALLGFGGGSFGDTIFLWDTNGTGDDLLLSLAYGLSADETAAIVFLNSLASPNNMTDHDNYLSPTLVLMNVEGADAGDYSAVVIGERAQSNVAVTHYFDFYAMVGTKDGSADATTTEIPAMFRIGDSGSATSDHSLSSGDTLFEDDVEIDGALYVDNDITASGTIQAEHIISTDDTYITDSLGVGAAPTAKFSVTGAAGSHSGYAAVQHLNTEAGSGSWLQVFTATGSAHSIGWYLYGVGAYDGTLAFGSDSKDPIQAWTNAGYVGINDLTPDYPFEILNTTSPQFGISDTDGVDYFTIGVDGNGDTTIVSSGEDISFSNARLVTTNSMTAASFILSSTGNISGKNEHLRFTLPEPYLFVTVTDVQLCIVPQTDAAITITNIEITCDVDPVSELNWNLMYADAFIGLANPVLIVAMDTTAGAKTITSFDDATVPINKTVYAEFDVTPHAAISQIGTDITFDYD